MKKITVLLSLIGLVFLSTGSVQASRPERTLTLPRESVGQEEIFLGTSRDPDSGRQVEGWAFVRYRDQYSHDKKKKAKKGPTGTSSTCYGHLAKGAKWKTVEPWQINPSNRVGLAESFVTTNFGSYIAKWEDAASGAVGDGVSMNILGEGTTTTSPLVAETAAPDGANEVLFANVSYPGAVGVTMIWGIFRGPTEKRELLEWDHVYDDTDNSWSATGESGKMDFESVATHELGHAVGLADLYKYSCFAETMYGYILPGETNKRTLEIGDITGVSKLYK